MKTVAAYVLAWTAAAACAQPPGAASQGAVYAVIHIDVDSAQSQKAKELLRTYAQASRKEAGCERVEVLEEPARLNHFALLETWSSMASLRAHGDGPVAKAMRQRLQPILGSPFDERLHTRVE